MIFQKYRTRNKTKKWSIIEDTYILNSKSFLFIQSIRLGRSKNAIINRLRKLSKSNCRLRIVSPTKTIGLRIVSKNSIQ